MTKRKKTDVKNKYNEKANEYDYDKKHGKYYDKNKITENESSGKLFSWIEAFVINAVLITVIYGFRLINYSVGIDTERAMVDYDNELNWVLGCGRWGAVLVRRLFMPKSFSYYNSVMFGMIILIIAMGSLMYVLISRYEFSELELALLVALFILHPNFQDLYYFVGFHVAWSSGILCCIWGIHFIDKGIRNEKLSFALVGMMLLTLAISMYQTIFYLAMAMELALYILWCKKEKLTMGEFFAKGGQYILSFIGSFLIYEGIYLYTTKVVYKPRELYGSCVDAREYISRQIVWGKRDVLNILERIGAYVKIFYTDISVAVNCSILIIFILLAATYIVRAIRLKKNELIQNTILLIFMISTVILPCVIKGNNITNREQIIYPFVLAFCMVMFHNEQLERKSGSKVIMAGAISLALIFGTLSMSYLLENQKRYNADVKYAENLYQDIKEYVGGDITGKQIIFLGKNQTYKTSQFVTGESEICGKSFFTADVNSAVGINYRVYYFMKTQDLNYVYSPIENFATRSKYQELLNNYPEENCMMMVDDIIYVRLSE